MTRKKKEHLPVKTEPAPPPDGVDPSVWGNEDPGWENTTKSNLIRQEILAQAEALLRLHMTEIREAMSENGNQISVGLKTDLVGSDPMDIKTTISFVTGKISDNLSGKVAFSQEKLPMDELEKEADRMLGEKGEIPGVTVETVDD